MRVAVSLYLAFIMLLFFFAGAFITKRLTEVHYTALTVERLGKGDIEKLLRQ